MCLLKIFQRKSVHGLMPIIIRPQQTRKEVISMRFICDHDYHLHSGLSLCSDDPKQTPQAILDLSKANGFKKICLTDHYWDESVPKAGRETVFLAFFSVFAVVKKSKKDIFSFAPIRLTDEAKRPQVRNPFRE